MIKRLLTVSVCLGAFLLGQAFAAPNTGSLLENLPALKNFKAARQSSFDPSGGNADGRQDWPIQPNETRQMAKIEGPGALTHIWVTIASHDPRHLKNIVLRMYWDGEEAPSVEAPIGDFFGLGHAKYYHYSSMPVTIGTNNALNCFWNMPFSNGAVVTVTNEGPEPVRAFYYYVDYQVYPHAPDEAGRFHAQYRQQYPCEPGKNYIFMEAQGRGHYVGCSLSIHNRADGWWGEGDDMIYVDGAETPTMNGTGSEDYFCGAWCYGDTFSSLFFGCPLRGPNKRNDLWNVYRYHLTDPIPFEKSIRVTIEHGHANDRNDDFSSVAFWYQTEPHAAFPALPAADTRLPGDAQVITEPGASEAEDLAPMFNHPDVITQDLSAFGTDWSNLSQLWFTGMTPAVYAMALPAAPTEAGTFNVELWYTVAPDYGIAQLWLNGAKVHEWDGYGAAVARQKTQFPIAIKEGENALEIKVETKNDQSTGFMAGIDCFKLTPQQ